MRMVALIQLTVRESIAKKTFIAFLGISTLVILLFVFAVNLDIIDGAKSYITLFGQEEQHAVSLKDFILAVESGISVALFTGGLFLALFATSSLIPSMLSKGQIDLLISKPISRSQILTGRYIGASVIVALNILYLVAGTWLVLSLKTGLWNGGFLLAGLMIIVTYMIIFSLMTFLGLLTGSGPFSLMITYLILFFSPILIERDRIYALLSSKVYGYLLDGLYHFLPKTAELGDMTQRLVRGMEIHSWLPLGTSLGFGAVMLIASVVVFSRKNF